MSASAASAAPHGTRARTARTAATRTCARPAARRWALCRTTLRCTLSAAKVCPCPRCSSFTLLCWPCHSLHASPVVWFQCSSYKKGAQAVHCNYIICVSHSVHAGGRCQCGTCQCGCVASGSTAAARPGLTGRRRAPAAAAQAAAALQAARATAGAASAQAAPSSAAARPPNVASAWPCPALVLACCALSVHADASDVDDNVPPSADTSEGGLGSHLVAADKERGQQAQQQQAYLLRRLARRLLAAARRAQAGTLPPSGCVQVKQK